jgi:tRNA (cytidine/uridine-2'-O-)-methyltransferase
VSARKRPLLHVVLHEPEIPNNTGNIGRTCVATGCALHLIHPLGFDTDEKACRRAGLDYWPRLDVREHASWPTYLASESPARFWLFSTKASRSVFDADFHPGDHLVFGKETAGLPSDILAAAPDRLLFLPMVPGERSLNVATAVCAVAYEAIRQMLARHELTLGADGRLITP